MKTVFVGMSGGVDSSVAALLLKNQGYEVVGVFMRCYNLDGCSEKDAEDARRVAEHINIPFYVWDFEEDYKKRVVEYMVEGYRTGITPNPDVMCNKEIKFGIFFEKALAAGADFVATGHYVQLKTVRGARALFAAKDNNKDQSYFLWTLAEGQLKHCLFPIGKYVKPEVRTIARKAKLPTAEKKDSQGICFLGNIQLSDFLKRYIPSRTGAVLATTGEKIGEHSGAAFYTIGQRHLGIRYDAKALKSKNSATQPLYVAGKNIKDNTVTVAEGNNNPALYKKEIALAGAHFISEASITNGEFPVFARVRYRQPLGRAMMTVKKNKGKNSPSIALVFEKPQKFVAQGQSAVFYSKSGQMLGGGIIL